MDEIIAHWNRPIVVSAFAAQTTDLQIVEKLAWLDVLRRNLNAGRERMAVLDVCCGTGFFAYLANDLGHKVTGVDSSNAMIVGAEQIANEREFRGSFVSRDAAKIEAEDGAFGAVIGRYALSNLREPAAALKEWLRVLRPGGRLILVEDDLVSAEGARPANFHRRAGGFASTCDSSRDQFPLGSSDPDQMATAVIEAGFEPLHVSSLAGQLAREGRWLINSYRLGYVILVAEKPDISRIELPTVSAA